MTTTLTRPMLEELLALTAPGGDEDEPVEVSLRRIEDGPDGPGLYAYYTEYPEEGVTLIDGKSEVLRAEGRASVAAPPSASKTQALTDEQIEKRDAWHGGHSYEASMLRNLLAVIHGDGGHYLEAHGLDKACEDAEARVVALLAASTVEGQAARRYQFLRDMIFDDRIIVAHDRMLHGEALDAAIDAALSPTPNKD